MIALRALVAANIVLLAVAPATDAATGTASWYDDGPGLYGAVHSWRFGDTPYRVEVTAPNGRHVIVTVRDHCPCGNGLVIDLSPEAFSALEPLSVGLIRNVTVIRVRGKMPAAPALPPTDTEPAGGGPRAYPS